MIVDWSKSQQEIDTQIDRLADEFRKNESSDEIHELERDGGRNSGGSGEMMPGGEYMDHRPIPQVYGQDEQGKRNDPKEKKQKKKIKSKISRS